MFCLVELIGFLWSLLDLGVTDVFFFLARGRFLCVAAHVMDADTVLTQSFMNDNLDMNEKDTICMALVF